MKYLILSVFFLPFVLLLPNCSYDSSYNESYLATHGKIKVESPSKTVFEIPLAKMKEEDKKLAFEEMMKQYDKELNKVRKSFSDRGISLDEMTGSQKKDFKERLLRISKKIRSSDEYRETPEALASIRSYTIPQAYIGFLGTHWSFGNSVSKSVTATIFVILQPVLEIGFDNIEGKVIYKTHKLKKAILGIPNLGVGIGSGVEATGVLGAGAIYGPLDHPRDLAMKISLGGSAGFGTPFGGGFAQASFIIKNPALFYYLVGVKLGPSLKVEAEGEIQAFLPIDDFLEWLEDNVENQLNSNPK